nr:CocE/NonD family hydrolase [Shimia sp. CNT1-13L.2]
MPDGTRLAARLWLPEGEPKPAILEYIPYRKRDMVRARDERNHPYFAQNGYASLRVDMRGSGDSEGVMPDMYDANELDDARCVIEWIASQPWCNGRVGMFGTSWGGTASLQAAVNAPGPLKAVLANCATIDRFEDDIHWMGGCLLTDSLEWGATLPAILASPPDSATVGDEWMAMWQARLKDISFPFENWAKHNRRGDYWRHGSVRFQADRLTCPVLTIGGWADRYSNSVMRLVQSRPDLCKGIVGPWGHHYPDHGEPGPGISFQDVALKWWDHWLKSDAPAESTWPSLQVWRREFDVPQDRLTMRNGTWVMSSTATGSKDTQLCLGESMLSPSPTVEAKSMAIPFDLRHGECAGDTGYFGRTGGLPLDQTPDDERALCFDTEQLDQDLDLFGHATLTLDLEIDSFPAQLACRLCEVSPDGRSNLVTRTVLALELDETLDGSRTIKPGEPCRYRIEFPTTAYRFQAGNRLRLALASSYWPLVWPTTHAPRLRLLPAKATLSLPAMPEDAKASPTPFPPAKDLPAVKRSAFISDGPLTRIAPNQQEETVHIGWHQPNLTMKFENIDLDFSYETNADYRIVANDPTSADCVIQVRFNIRRSDGSATVASRIHASGKPDGFSVKSVLSATWNDQRLLDTSTEFTS